MAKRVGTNRAGAKKAHPRPLDDAHAAAAIRAFAAYAQRKNMPLLAQLSELAGIPGRDDLHEDTEAELALGDFEPAPNTLRAASLSLTPPNPWTTYAIYLWMRELNHAELMDFVLEENAHYETEVRALKRLLGHDGVLSVPRVRGYAGDYQLYRPYHLAPSERIILAGLRIGSDASLFDCRIDLLSVDEFDEPKPSVFTGKIVPHGQRMMAILASTGNKTANYILHFDNIEWDGEKPFVVSLNGIMIAAVGPHQASAWPIFARRCEAPVAPGVLDREAYRDLARPVREALGRGAIHWRRDDYPWPFGSAETGVT